MSTSLSSPIVNPDNISTGIAAINSDADDRSGPLSRHPADTSVNDDIGTGVELSKTMMKAVSVVGHSETNDNVGTLPLFSQATTVGEVTSSSNEIIEGTPPSETRCFVSKNPQSNGNHHPSDTSHHNSEGDKVQSGEISSDFYNAPTLSMSLDLQPDEAGDVYNTTTQPIVTNGGGESHDALSHSPGAEDNSKEMEEEIDSSGENIIPEAADEIGGNGDKASGGDGKLVEYGETESELEAINQINGVEEPRVGHARELISNQKLAKELEGQELISEEIESASSDPIVPGSNVTSDEHAPEASGRKKSSRNKTVSTTSHDTSEGQQEGEAVPVPEQSHVAATKRGNREDDEESTLSKRARRGNEPSTPATPRTGLRERKAAVVQSSQPASAKPSAKKRARDIQAANTSIPSKETPTRGTRSMPERASKNIAAISAVIAASVSSDNDSEVEKYKTPKSGKKGKADRNSKTPGRGSSKKTKQRGTSLSNSKNVTHPGLDPYDVDNMEHDAQSPLEPLRHVHMARDNFGGFRFQIKNREQPSSGSKYSHLSRNKNQRRSAGAGGEVSRNQGLRSPQDGGEVDVNAPTLPMSSSLELSQPKASYKMIKTNHVRLEKRTPSGSRLLKKLSYDTSIIKEITTPRLPAPFAKQLSPDMQTFESGEFADRSSSSSGGQKSARKKSAKAKKKKTNRANTPSSRRTTRNASVDADDVEDRLHDVSPAHTPVSGSKGGRKTPGKFAIGDKFHRPVSDFNLPSTPEEQVLADFPTERGSLLPGARVLARWRDGTHYPGHVLLRDGYGRYKVRFLDRYVRDMPPPDVFPVAALNVGDVLMVDEILEDENDEELRPIKILKCPSPENSQEWYFGLFQVFNTVTNEEEFISWERMRIDKEQTPAYVESLRSKQTYDIVTDNIMSSRARLARQAFVPAVSGAAMQEQDLAGASPQTPNARSVKKRSPRVAAAAATPSTSHAKPTRSAFKKVPKASTTKKKTSKEARLPDTTATDEVEEMDVEEETAVDASNIFSGLSFVLTSASRKPPADEAEEAVPVFNKKEVRMLIMERGGTVIDDFSTVEDRLKCILVADTHYRTHKYLSALARAIPCASHVWIHDCCRQNKLLPYKNYMLPAGNSLETNGVVEWHEACPTLLEGLTVLVHTEHRPTNPQSMDFVQIWAPLVRCMGANVLEAPPKPGRSPLDILLTDVSCPDHLLILAGDKNAILVSSEWLIQAIISGIRPDPAGHEKYRYDFMEQ